MTLIEQEDSVINTYATRVTSKELKMMSGEENLHSLIDVELTDENGLLFEGPFIELINTWDEIGHSFHSTLSGNSRTS